MSAMYEKYKKMSEEELQRLIKEGKVTLDYLNWLGIKGPGQELREIVSKKRKSK